jgi:cyanophycinase
LLLAAGSGRPLWETTLQTGGRHDLTMLRRAAVERARGDFPPVAPAAPVVESGSLVIVGGGTMPMEVVQTFLELAGGKEAPVVVLPIAAGDTLGGDVSSDTRLFTRAGATNVRSLRARTLAEVSEPGFAEALREARGVWFGGGRQWRFIDAYYATPAHELLRDVLRRGGVIGGSSAGASIQGEYMPRGSPLGNTDMMAEGYERGLGFLPGVAIDQHFSARRRQGDMTRLVARYPQLLGIGIDEGTALVVRGSSAHVVGRGRAYIFDHRSGKPGGERDSFSLRAGEAIDLPSRRVID